MRPSEEANLSTTTQREHEKEEEEEHQEEQQANKKRRDNCDRQKQSTSSNYLAGLVTRSATLVVGTLKQQYASYLTGATINSRAAAGLRHERASDGGSGVSSVRPTSSGGGETTKRSRSCFAAELPQASNKDDTGDEQYNKTAQGTTTNMQSSSTKPATAGGEAELSATACGKKKLQESATSVRQNTNPFLSADVTQQTTADTTDTNRPQPPSATTTGGGQPPRVSYCTSRNEAQVQSNREEKTSSTITSDEQVKAQDDDDDRDRRCSAGPTTPTLRRPPLPPPPPKELVRACAAKSASTEQRRPAPTPVPLTPENSPPVHTPTPTSTPGRRHALQEHSLERDAALSVLKVNHAKDLKHKRTSSIKSALKHAHLGPLRSAASKRALAEKAASTIAAVAAAASASGGGGSAETAAGPKKLSSSSGSSSASTRAKSTMPYELFEPPITQRTFERSKRRGAMATQRDMDDSRRQMSVDTIGLRQLTDEFFQNVGVHSKQGAAHSSSGQLSLVTLSGPTHNKLPAAKPGTIAVPGGSSTVAAVVAGSSGGCSSAHTSGSCGGLSAASSQAQAALEAQLYQATRAAAGEISGDHAQSYRWRGCSAHRYDSFGGAGSTTTNSLERQDSFSQVTCLPGNLPWQSDVSIQCELLQAPNASQDQYETTGDILDTITRPFRGPPLSSYATASFDTSSHHNHHHHHHHHHLSATLKRGLSAISQNHLSPAGVGGPPCSTASSMALNVVGSLKKSISNTFDVGGGAAAAGKQQQQQTGGGPNQQQSLAANHSRALTLRSQDSLPAYASLQNEPDDADSPHSSSSNSADQQQQQQQQQQPSSSSHNHLQLQQQQQHGLIGQLASKLSRQSSKKFTVGKKGLQRALSFDCRGYKRLGEGVAGSARPAQGEGASAAQTSADSTTSSLSSGVNGGGGGGTGNQLLAARSRAHNKSTLALLQSPRPYLPQSASQVDFQVPLLPYDRMQEAIVSQRLLEPPLPSQSGSQSGGADERASCKQTGDPQPDVDELLCGPPAGAGAGVGAVVANQRNVNEDNCPTKHNSNRWDRGEALHNRNCQQQQDPSTITCAASSSSASASAATARKPTPPRLVLNIPIIATSATNQEENEEREDVFARRQPLGRNNNQEEEEEEDEEEEEEEEEGELVDQTSQATTVITCLPSPNVHIDTTFSDYTNTLGVGGGPGHMSQSPSFCIDPTGKSTSAHDLGGSNLLTASDVFSKSKSFIKRPSTMMAADEAEDAMNQVAQALDQASQGAAASQGLVGSLLASSGSVRRSRRQAIVPPKLATDVNCTSSESDAGVGPQVGRLVDLTDEGATVSAMSNSRSDKRRKSMDEFGADEEAQLSTIRRKRSGGGIEKTTPVARCHNLPTVQIEDSSCVPSAPSPVIFGVASGSQRPDSQATNADSLVSSGSSTTLSAFASGPLSPYGRGGPHTSGAQSPQAGGGGGGPRDNNSLSVAFNSGASGSRRRSSIAVIPQMQICPGDLLVYSKQLIDRMNQSDENEPPPQFLTIDENKKGKLTIWSSFKLCAQFDNRTLRARNELLCSLEDVLASLQPSTFVDEQLSHYKGMLWSEFFYETESRRSAGSSAAEDEQGDETAGEENKRCKQPPRRSYRDELCDVVRVRISSPSPNDNTTSTSGGTTPATTTTTTTTEFRTPRRSGSMRGDEQLPPGKTPPPPPPPPPPPASSLSHHEGLKTTTSTGGASSAHASPSRGPGGGGGGAPGRALSSRFREKPKLKRGQTVDSVFRIPLIPSSPLKHAQQHQQTPTAHLEDHELNIIEDDERSSMGSANSGGAPAGDGGKPAAGALDQQPADKERSGSLCRRKRSSSARSRSGSRSNQKQPAAGANSNSNDPDHLGGGSDLASRSQDSSIDAEDTRDLMEATTASGGRHRGRSPNGGGGGGGGPGHTPNQIVRQSSLSTLSSTITRTEQKRQHALWDLFQSECTFFFDHLMTLKNVYMEPLKKIQVEGFAMFADPDVLFGNLDELCCGVYDFCKEFLYIIMRTLKTRPEELNATDVLIKLYKKNPKIDHLRAVYHRYTLNYINALTYLESLRRQVEFVEFEKWSSRDVRCKKLQLTDLLVAPVQHIMRVPIILKDIESHTENARDRDEIRAILAVEEASLRELDDKMRWLKNFERLLEIQKNIIWPSVFDMEAKLYVPEFLKDVLSKQPCEKLIVSPRRQIVHEGTLQNFDLAGKASDMHVILFDDMLVFTRRKKGLTKKASTVVCKTNSSGGAGGGGGSGSGSGSGGGGGGSGGGQHGVGHGSSSASGGLLKDDGSYKYIVYKQPLSLDRFYVHDVQQVDSQSIGIKHLFLLIVMNRFQQIINVHSFAAPNDDIKQTWLFKIKKTAERWKRNNSSSSGAVGPANTQQQQQQQDQQRRVVQQQPQQQQVSSSKSMPGGSRGMASSSYRSAGNQNQSMINNHAAGGGGGGGSGSADNL